MAESQSLLSSEELAALSASLSDDGTDTTPGYNLDVQVRKHDLAAEDSSLGVNVASLDMINERFIRLFRLGMLEVLRTSPRMNPTRTQIMRFGDYLKDLKSPLSVNIVRMSPLRGYAMVVIEPTVVFSSLDSFFGGFGRGVGQLPPGRLFTPTETRIIKIILQVFFRSFKEAWSPSLPKSSTKTTSSSSAASNPKRPHKAPVISTWSFLTWPSNPCATCCAAECKPATATKTPTKFGAPN